MPRIRTIKPEVTDSRSMGRVSREARLCFMLLWTLADDEGRLKGAQRLLVGKLYPYDDDVVPLLPQWLTELEGEKCIQRYVVDEEEYILIVNWHKHQRIEKRGVSRLPVPPSSGNPPGVVEEGSRSVPGGLFPSRAGQDQDPGRGKEKDPEGGAVALARAVLESDNPRIRPHLQVRLGGKAVNLAEIRANLAEQNRRTEAELAERRREFDEQRRARSEGSS